MKRTTRGAARISAVWLIVLVVLFLVAIAFAFIAQSDMTAARESAEQANQERQGVIDQMAATREQVRDISTLLGWYDRQSANPVSDVDTAKAAIEQFKGTFADLGAGDADFETMLPKVVAAYNQIGREAAELRARIQTLEGEVQAAQQATADVQREKDATIAQLRQQIADETQNHQQQQQELQTRLAAAQSQLSERDLELRQFQASSQQEKRELEKQLIAKDTRINELARATKFSRPPLNASPDGKVIEVSTELGLGWIDLGSNDRLTTGMRFRVESARPGDRRLKAFAQVTRVEADRAEVLFSDLTDRYDPVAAGDVIVNPLYDPSGERNAVLIGRFSGTFNEKDLQVLLGSMGIHVQKALDRTTHFLIVGSELWSDPETNEPLEEPLQPSELPLFKNAEAMGVQIIPLQDIREFFRVDLGSGRRSAGG